MPFDTGCGSESSKLREGQFTKPDGVCRNRNDRRAEGQRPEVGQPAAERVPLEAFVVLLLEHAGH